MFVSALLLIAAAPTGRAEPPAYEPKEEDPYKTCPDGMRVLRSSTCPRPQELDSPPPFAQPKIPDKSRPAKPSGNPGGWATTNDYPPSALAGMREGTTGFRVTVSADGRVSKCEITSSSGVEELDEATCANVTRRARFMPALDNKGNPTTGTYRNRITWRVPTGGSAVSLGLVDMSFPRPPRLPASKVINLLDMAYPAKAKAELRSGAALIAVEVNPTGLVTNCSISRSSGHADLDAKACELSKAWIYEPALDSTGQPASGRSIHNVNWRLPPTSIAGEKPAPLQVGANRDRVAAEVMSSGSLDISFTVKADGSVADCKIEGSGKLYGIGVDQRKCEPTAELAVRATRFHADAVDRKVRYRTSIEIDPPFPDVPPTVVTVAPPPPAPAATQEEASKAED